MRIGLIALLALAAGCASASPPPGGPEDHAPPRLLKVTPDTNAVNVHPKAVTFQFDETINDRGSGPLELDNYFLVSPSDGAPRINWHRSRIDVQPRHDFRPNTAYTITLLPGLTDLRNNVMKSGATVIFSTGPDIPPHRITGIVFDWQAERPALRALVQAITPDSQIYLAQSDSVGRFSLGPLPVGSYLVRAIIDQNGNRALDRNEAFDTVRVTVPLKAPLELLTALRDTLPPRIITVTVADSVTLRVTFDRMLSTEGPPPASAFRLAGADSAAIPILAVLTPRDEVAKTKAAQQAVTDSVRRADSLAGKPAPALTPAPPPARGARAPIVLPTPTIPPPPVSLALKIAKPLALNTLYRLRVTDAKSLSGRVQSSERSFTTPKPPPPPAADSTKKRPPTPVVTPVPAGPPPATAPPSRPPRR